ncbi:MAG: hypothetical protein JW862_14905 [Anaerolineales bacterium]|nr:hypothetical protein [Anaerolineales bacterium]
MLETIFTHPLSVFLVCLALATGLNGLGRLLAGPSHDSAVKSSTYSSGEAAPQSLAVPGYRPFFVLALFFAVLHLGVLVVASGGLNLVAGVYLLGLLLALLALILG